MTKETTSSTSSETSNFDLMFVPEYGVTVSARTVDEAVTKAKKQSEAANAEETK